MRLILASASPRRADLLRAAGYRFQRIPVDIDERAAPGEAAADYVQRLAAEKAARAWAATSRRGRDRVVLGADTAVVLGTQILGKPATDADAGEMLRHLSGRSHNVLTGIAVRARDVELNALELTSVWFGELSEEEIAWYVGTGEGRDKAGAYAIQGLAARFIPRIEGSYSNVVGLPVATVHALLKRTG